jgi:hypothetical protein
MPRPAGVTIQSGPQLGRCGGWIRSGQDRADDGDAGAPGGQHVRDVVRRDASNRQHRHDDRLNDRLQHRDTLRRNAWVRVRGKDIPIREVVGAGTGGTDGLLQRMHRTSDELSGGQQGTNNRWRQTLLAKVNTRGADRQGNIYAIVDDETGAGFPARFTQSPGQRICL